MVPLSRTATIGGRPAGEVLGEAALDEVVQRTRDGGAEVVRLLQRGSAYWAPSAAVMLMVRAILRDEQVVLPIAARLSGQFGIDGVYVGVPARLGRGGVSEIVTAGLDEAEVAALRAAAEEVRSRVAGLHELGLMRGPATPSAQAGSLAGRCSRIPALATPDGVTAPLPAPTPRASIHGVRVLGRVLPGQGGGPVRHVVTRSADRPAPVGEPDRDEQCEQARQSGDGNDPLERVAAVRRPSQRCSYGRGSRRCDDSGRVGPSSQVDWLRLDLTRTSSGNGMQRDAEALPAMHARVGPGPLSRHDS